MNVRTILGALVIASAVSLSASPALACIANGFAGPPLDVTDMGGGAMEIRIGGYDTFAEASTNCGCGLSVGGVITSVDAASVVNADTSTPVSGFGAFSSNATTASDLEGQVATGTWSGFSAAVTSVAGGTAADLVFTVSVAMGTTVSDVVNEVRKNGLAGTDEVDGSGNLTLNHLTIVSPSAPSVPTFGWIGLVALCALLGLIGARWLLRGSRRLGAAPA